MSRIQIPLKRPVTDQNDLLTQPWAFFFQQFVASLPDIGTGYVTDGSAGTYAPMRVFQGPASNRGSAPGKGDIYFSNDDGTIYVEKGGTWSLQSGILVGDVLKPAGSNATTLSTVNPNVGTWGDSTTIPVVTVDEKGRVTSVVTVPVQAPLTASAGVDGAIQFSTAGGFNGNGAFVYEAALQRLQVQNINVGGVITFTTPLTTFNNLSPLTTAGDLLTHDGTNNIRLPAGNVGDVLHTSTGQELVWKPDTLVFTQAIPLATWTIVHNLGKYPSVTVIDSANEVVFGDVAYVDSNTITLTFAGGFSGTCYLN